MTEIGFKIVRLDVLDSTNEYAKELIGRGFFGSETDGASTSAEGASSGEGLVVVAAVQKKGKGRLDRLWESPKGGLWLSVILEPREPITGDKLGALPLMAGCAAAGAMQYALDTALEEFAGAGPAKAARVKWPNDVIINGRKACGILGETISHQGRRYAVMGIGINVNNRVREGYEFSPVSTSLIEELGAETDIGLVERALLSEMSRLYGMMNKDPGLVLDEWKKLADTLGRRVCVNTPSGEITGLAKDIDKNGALMVEVEEGVVVRVTVGDCRHLD